MRARARGVPMLLHDAIEMTLSLPMPSSLPQAPLLPATGAPPADSTTGADNTDSGGGGAVGDDGGAGGSGGRWGPGEPAAEASGTGQWQAQPPDDAPGDTVDDPPDNAVVIGDEDDSDDDKRRRATNTTAPLFISASDMQRESQGCGRREVGGALVLEAFTCARAAACDSTSRADARTFFACRHRA